MARSVGEGMASTSTDSPAKPPERLWVVLVGRVGSDMSSICSSVTASRSQDTLTSSSTKSRSRAWVCRHASTPDGS